MEAIMIIIGTLAGLAFIYVLLRVFSPIKNEKVESSKSEESSSSFDESLNNYCIEVYGKPYNELSEVEQEGAAFMYCHN